MSEEFCILRGGASDGNVSPSIQTVLQRMDQYMSLTNWNDIRVETLFNVHYSRAEQEVALLRFINTQSEVPTERFIYPHTPAASSLSSETLSEILSVARKFPSTSIFVHEPRAATDKHFALTASCSYPKHNVERTAAVQLTADRFVKDDDDALLTMDDSFEQLEGLLGQ